MTVMLAMLGQVDFWLHASVDAPARLGFAAMVVVATLCLAWRASAPLLSSVVCLAALTLLGVGNLLDMVWVYPVMLLSVYSAARHAPPRRAVVAGPGTRVRLGDQRA